MADGKLVTITNDTNYMMGNLYELSLIVKATASSTQASVGDNTH